MGIYDDLAKLSKSSPTPQVSEKQPEQKEETASVKTKTPRYRDTTIPRHHDTTVSRYQDTIIEIVRKAVRDFGKEAATHRFTVEEKRAIADLIYAYSGRGVKTSENEITRVAVNFIVADYRENGENSILDKVLKALNE